MMPSAVVDIVKGIMRHYKSTFSTDRATVSVLLIIVNIIIISLTSVFMFNEIIFGVFSFFIIIFILHFNLKYITLLAGAI